MNSDNPLVAVISGSESDGSFVDETLKYLDYFGVPFEAYVLSAHRNPTAVSEFARGAAEKGVKVIIAQAGMAAHLAGAVASNSLLPVIGVPLPGSALEGVDALYSTVQMPAGVPVATMAIGKAGSRNAAVFALEILALGDESFAAKLRDFRSRGSKI